MFGQFEHAVGLFDGQQPIGQLPALEVVERAFTLAHQVLGDAQELGFNVSYLLDVLGVLSGDQNKLCVANSTSSALLEESVAGDSLYVVMPMRL